MKSTRLYLCLLVIYTVPVFAGPKKSRDQNKPPSIVNVSPDSSHQNILVAFKAPASNSSVLLDATKWSVTLSYKSGKPPLFLQATSITEWSATIIGSPTNANPSRPPSLSDGKPAQIITVKPGNGAVILTLPPGTLSSDIAALSVSYDQVPFVWSPASATKPTTSLFSAAPNQSQSDNYLSGSYSPAIHSAAQYTINGQATYTHEYKKSGLSFGGTATVATDQRPTADPDSFLVSALVEWSLADHSRRFGPFGGNVATGLLLNWDAAGLEFDRKTTTKTFVSSPLLEIPLCLYPCAPIDVNAQSAAKERFPNITAAMYPYVGLTVGTNLSNALQPGGSGLVVRGVVGASLSLTYKVSSSEWIQKIGLTATDTMRAPATNEVLTYTHYISATGKTVSTPVLSTNIRNHLNAELDLTIAKPFSLTVKYEDGELPPAFSTVNSKVTIGLTIMLQQNNTPRTKTSPEK